MTDPQPKPQPTQNAQQQPPSRKKRQRRPWKPLLLWSLLGLLILIAGYFLIGWPKVNENAKYGITWSKPYAESLGLNSRDGLGYMLEDVGVRRFRIPAYWSLTEPERGRYDFSWLDEQIELIDRYGGSVTLGIGARLPRWPECWEPEWTHELSPTERREAQLKYARDVYERYAEHPAIDSWQIENEVTFDVFANCEGLTNELVEKELQLIRGLEQSRPPNLQRPVVTTESGEWSTWLSFAGDVDGKGISIYRAVTDPWLGVIRYWFVPPWAYQRKAALVRAFVGPVHVSEFQMEPWADLPLTSLTNETQFRTLDIDQMEANLRYAERTGFDEVYFWGAEWWLWMQEMRDHPEFIEMMSEFFQENR